LKKIVKHLSVLLLIVNFVGILNGCVEPYEKSFGTTKKIIIIEGLLADDLLLRPITIKESLADRVGSSNVNAIKGAKVSILINGKTSIELPEKEEGTYYFNENFKGEVGSTYQLKFSTPDGNQYASTIEKLEPNIPIQKVYHQLDLTAITDAKGKASAGYKFYLDFKDPAGIANQYLWQWVMYEKQNVCQTCVGGYYYKTPLPNGACVADPILSRYNNTFDYGCQTDCWELLKSSDLVVNNDALSDGNAIKGQFVGKIPVYQNSGALLEISQYAISKDAYNFIKLTQQQSVLTGSLADTPPAALVGNVTCLNDPTVNTSGFFIVAGKAKKQYWLDRTDALDQRIPTVGLLGGRAVRFEPAGANSARPPLAPCIKGLNRTNQKPNGWQD
jgi:Domain of unknown function (DUF4249)